MLGIVIWSTIALVVLSGISSANSVVGAEERVGLTAPLAISATAPAEGVPSPTRIAESAGFLANVGQLEREDVHLYASLGDLTVGFTPRALLLNLRERSPPQQGEGPEERHTPDVAPHSINGVLVRLAFDGSNPVIPVGRVLLPHPTHFFLGDDPANWHTEVASFREVVYAGLYDGIDLVYRLQGGQLKYEFHVRPGSDPGAIRWTIEGAESTSIDAMGNLVIHTQAGDLLDDAPYSFHADEPARAVSSRYALFGGSTVGFVIGAHEPSRPLVIDPGLDYSTFLGGASNDVVGFNVVLDAGGNATVTGYTGSIDFPTTPGAYDTTQNGGNDAFVLRLNPSGKNLVYSTFVGGSGDDVGEGIALEANGGTVVTGYTISANFPTTSGAFDRTFNGLVDGFVFRLNGTGNSLVFSTFIGGLGQDYPHALALDAAGATVTGHTNSADFPTTANAFDTFFNGFIDAFVFRLNPSGTGLDYSTFVGGSNDDIALAVALDGVGTATIIGYTTSANFPVTSGAYDLSFNGNYDTIVFRLDATGTNLLYSTFVGGTSDDFGRGFALDGSGSATVTGYTNSANFPVTSGAYDTSFSGVYDAFVFRLNPSGSSLDYSTFVGGSLTDVGNGLAVDAAGTATVVGYTASPGFPTTAGAYDSTSNGNADAFVLRLDPSGSRLLYGTFVGGSLDDIGRGVALYESATVSVTGYTASTNFPTTPGAYDNSYTPFGYDAFVLRLTASAEPAVSQPGVQGYVDAPDLLHVTDFAPELNWTYADLEGEPQAQHEVRVGTTSGGSEMWSPGPQAGPATSVAYVGSTLFRGVDYFFGVRAFDGNSWSSWAEVRFRLNEIPNPPRAPVSPVDGSTIPAYPVQTLWWISGGDADGDPLSFEWEVATDPSFATLVSSGTAMDPTTAPFATSPSTSYFWRVFASDGYEDSSYGNTPLGYWTFTTTNPNDAPSADAGRDQTVRKHTLVTLNGSLSSDPDGDPLTFEWVAEPDVSLSSADVASPTFTPSRRGVYSFVLTVDDGRGGAASDAIAVTATNDAANADAGSDQVVRKNALVTLDASASADSDGDSLSYLWFQSGGDPVSLTGATSAVATFTPTTFGIYTFMLTVDDDDGGSDTDSVVVTVQGQAPSAAAGADQSVPKHALVTLDGSASSDPDGDPLSYRWEQMNGPVITLTGATSAIATFTPTISGSYSFTLTVEDVDGESDMDSVVVMVENLRPTADAGPHRGSHKNALVTLDGSASSDPDGDPLSYRWEQVGGPTVTLTGSTTSTASFTPSMSGIYKFALTVEDGEGGSDSDSLVVTVTNRAPTAAAGPDQNVLRNVLVTVDGGSSSDPDGDSLLYGWEQISGPAITLTGAAGATATFTPTMPGTYTFTLTVEDEEGASALDLLVVTVTNRAPTAAAGPDQNVPRNALVTLDGSASSDPDGDSLFYRWEQNAGPSASLSGATNAIATFTPTSSGTYGFTLTVDDGVGGIGTKYVGVVVANGAPAARAGPDQTVPSRTLASLNGAGSSDPDGDALAYSWEQVGGPAVTLTGADTAIAIFTPPQSGSYAFALTVTDGEGAWDRDVAIVTAQNGAPIARAGPDDTVPKNERVTLDGSASSDPEGDSLSYFWRQVSGPAVTLSGASEAIAAFTPTISGTYTFTVTVSDGDGQSNTDSVVTTVQNRRPEARAGSDQTGEPGVSFTLDAGASSDPDGETITFAWTQEGGPSTTLEGADTGSVDLMPLEVGTYVFRLTVTDEEGASDVDTILVYVEQPAPVRAPAPFPVGLALLVLVVVFGVLSALFFWRRRKKEAMDHDGNG